VQGMINHWGDRHKINRSRFSICVLVRTSLAKHGQNKDLRRRFEVLLAGPVSSAAPGGQRAVWPPKAA